MLGKNFLGKRLTFNDILNEVELLEVNLAVCSLFGPNFRAISLEIVSNVGILSVYGKNGLCDYNRLIVRRIIHQSLNFFVGDSGHDSLLGKSSFYLLYGNIRSSQGRRIYCSGCLKLVGRNIYDKNSIC